jgi:hypothetical protein
MLRLMKSALDFKRTRTRSLNQEPMMPLNLTLTTTALVAALIPLLGMAESPFVCNLKALTTAERTEHKALTARVLAAVTDTHELSNGYTFGLHEDVSLADLTKWVDFERRCCPFFDFQLTWARENGPVTLQLTGRDGVKEFIRAEFSTLFGRR